MYDLIIIGMGPAGMSAGLYAKRSGLNTLIIDGSAPGGLLNKISIVENYLGVGSISGIDLALKMFEQIRNEEVPYKIETVVSVKNNNEYKSVYTTKGEYKTKTIIFALGRKPKSSSIPFEEKFKNKGISYCAICDASLYKNKELVVLGGGNSAFEEALYLNDFASKITIIVKDKISADDSLVNDVKSKNINIMTNTSVCEFLGDDKITGVKLDNGNVINCSGVFIYYGYSAQTSFINNLDITDDKGYILVDKDMKTKVDGIYACGDIIKKNVYQIITACSEGAISALSAKKYISNTRR